MNVSKTTQFFFTSIRPQYLSNNTIELTKNIDWNKLLEISIKTRTTPLIYNRTQSLQFNSFVPDDILREMQKFYFKNLRKNTLIYNEFEKIGAHLNSGSISPILLKGIYLAHHIYENISLRQLSDIDVLLEENNIEPAAQKILSLGFRFKGTERTDFILQHQDIKHIPMMCNNQGVGIELHKKIFNEWNGYSVPQSCFFEDLQSVRYKNVHARVFYPELFIVSLCLHIDEHVQNAQMHFIGYIDIAWFLQKKADSFNWEKLISFCSEHSIKKYVFPHILISHTYLKAPVPDDVTNQLNKYRDDYYESFFLHTIEPNEHLAIHIKNANIAGLKRVKGTKNKLKFLLHNFFPSKSFMVYRYKIKNKKLYFLYYFVRFGDGIRSLFSYLSGKTN